ncbi:MAG: hypothetical protein WC529_02015 [Candidatus Margulisiibacteriota bacterium]
MDKYARRLLAAAVLIILTAFLLSYFDLRYILLDTTPTGGDTPAHNYLVRHLAETFFSRGAVISWAPGWWCGFPMYQYYFFFPYWVMALLGAVIPLNIAFKIISILGILLLPAAVYFSLKWLDFGEPVPLIGAIMAVPFLFVETHTMWGVNIYSTLAGEISNSISFLFFVLFLGSFYGDMKSVRFRLRTVFLFTLMFYTHFFTSVIAGVVSFALLFLFGFDRFRERLVVYLKTNGLTFLLIAWWAVPLVAKSAYSMEFGGDWDKVLWQTFPPYVLGFLPLVLYALWKGITRKKANVLLLLVLLLTTVAAFYTGGKINASFTNIRFWPFIYYALVMLTAVGAGFLLRGLKGRELLVGALLLAMLLVIANSRNNVRGWVKWNYEGLENKADYPSFRDLVLPLDKTPGRLANDLHPYNDHLGSTRVFETVPALIDKPILEGGIVNSATGSMFSYYIQGEMSQNSAGFPTVVNPASFDPGRGTRHLKLANVKHFIAHWDQTRQALRRHPEWKLLKSAGQYDLFELTSNDGRYVYVPASAPLAVKTKQWKERSMEWLYTIDAIDQPFILYYGGASPEVPVVSEEEYLAYLSHRTRGSDGIPLWLVLGPFYFPAGIGDERAADLEFVKISELRPAAGARQAGKAWQPILRQGPIFLDSLYQPKYNFVCYSYVGINADRELPARLHYSNDDHCRIYLNGRQIVRDSITGLNSARTVEVTLRRGVNHLVYKLEQSVGGVFFQARLTDRSDQPLSGISYFIGQDSRPLGARATEQAGTSAITEEHVSGNEIRFRTRALHQPHIIKVSYFPNWQVRGAKRVYHVTPNYLLVYPEQAEVVLYYGSLPVDVLGRLLTLAGALIFAGLLLGRKR